LQIIFFVQGEQNMTREQTRSAEVWPRRLPASIEPPVVSLWDNLSVSARRYPKKTALAFFDCRITYEELAGAAERLAAQLAVFGVRRGDRVLVVMQNCPQLVIAHYAIEKYGPDITGVSIKVKDVELSPVDGKGGLKRIKIDPSINAYDIGGYGLLPIEAMSMDHASAVLFGLPTRYLTGEFSLFMDANDDLLEDSRELKTFGDMFLVAAPEPSLLALLPTAFGFVLYRRRRTAAGR